MGGMTDGIYSKQKTSIYTGEVEAKPLMVGKMVIKNRKPTHHTCLITPFAGKKYCFKEYLRGIKQLPLDQMYGIWYDNSNDIQFRKKLIATGKKLFAHFTLLIDDTPPMVVETTQEYQDISWRCHQIFRTIQEYVPDVENTLIIEDDTEPPKDGVEKLHNVLAMDKRIATAVGNVCSRRLKDRACGIPILWHYTVEQTYPANGTRVTESRLVKKRDLGIELIGASHTAFWLTRTKVLKKLGFRWYEDGVKANDQVWGYRVNKAGYLMAVDHSILCKHWWLSGGEKGYY